MSTTPPQRRDRRHDRHDQTQAEIVETAWQIARQQGVGAVSLREVARLVGVRPQSLYTYIASKNALFDAMFEQATTELVMALRDVPGDTADERLRVGCRRFVHHCVQQPERFALVFQRSVPGFVPGPRSMRAAGDLLAGMTSALADVGAQDPATTDLFTAGITGLISQQISNDPNGDRWTSLLDRLINALLTA